MTIDQPILLALAGVVGTAIGVLFRSLLAAKDAHITELRETVKYQRGISELLSGTAHRAVGTLEKVT